MHIHVLSEKITKFSTFPNVIQIYLPVPSADSSLLPDRLWLSPGKEIIHYHRVVFPFDTEQELDSMILIGPFQLGLFCDSRHRPNFFCLYTQPSKINHYFNRHSSDAAVQPWVSYRHSYSFSLPEVKNLSSMGVHAYIYLLTCLIATGPCLLSPIGMNRATPFLSMELPNLDKDLDKMCHGWLKMARA